MESLLIQLNSFIQIFIKKNDTYDWFCGPGSHFIKRTYDNCITVYNTVFRFE